jgi:serine/threonine protein kinase
MELVKGIPITQYCDENRLAPKERLVLFMLVCNAVQHAHTKGIIHRDLKPSNILIAMQDGKPVPKVIDFGIAKAIDQKLTEKTVFTEYHQLIGTPEYMSPEQAEMSGIDIDTRSDVYSLGVLLYELLTGTTPFDPRELRRAGYGEIQRIIREVEPPRPSTRLTDLLAQTRTADGRRPNVTRDSSTADSIVWKGPNSNLQESIEEAIAELKTPQAIARHRRSEPHALCKSLRGDLDLITMKALEKDRTRRYDTASAFEMDILRYLCDEAVSASPPQMSYRLRKFVRRNRTMVVSASAIILALLVGFASTITLAVRQAGSRHEAELSRMEAERERDKALLALTNAYEELSRSLGSQHPSAQRAARLLAETLDECGQTAKAAEWRAKLAPQAIREQAP